MRSDIAARPIAWAGFAIAAVVATLVVLVFLLLHFWQASPSSDRARVPYEMVVPGPVLQSAPQLDLRAYRDEKQRLIETAAWIDPQRGIARIPVADAMELLAAPAAPTPQGQQDRP
jgi:hypothetical protein